MLDRASTFSDPEVVRLLKTKFVPVAIDQAYQRRQKDAEGRFYQKIANQGPRKVGNGGPTTQGLYAASANGTFLGYNNNRGAGRVIGMLNKALKEFEAGPVEVEARFVPPGPAGGGTEGDAVSALVAEVGEDRDLRALINPIGLLGFDREHVIFQAQ